MSGKPKIFDVTLAPGEFFFGSDYTRIHTLLGSCVAITLWHPQKHIGGMCHYLLPTRSNNPNAMRGCYADEAVQLFLKEIQLADTSPQEYEVKLFGGSKMFKSLTHSTGPIAISQDNIDTGKALLKHYGFPSIKATDVGGRYHRKIYLELWSGDVWVRRGQSINEGPY